MANHFERGTYENLKPVFKKSVFRNIERFLAFLTFKFSKSIHCPFSEMETYFLQIYGEWFINNPSFHTDLRNVNFILVKSASEKSFRHKTVLPIEKLAKSQKNRLFGQNFFGMHLLLRSNLLF